MYGSHQLSLRPQPLGTCEAGFPEQNGPQCKVYALAIIHHYFFVQVNKANFNYPASLDCDEQWLEHAFVASGWGPDILRMLTDTSGVQPGELAINRLEVLCFNRQGKQEVINLGDIFASSIKGNLALLWFILDGTLQFVLRFFLQSVCGWFYCCYYCCYLELKFSWFSRFIDYITARFSDALDCFNFLLNKVQLLVFYSGIGNWFMDKHCSSISISQPLLVQSPST